ncbi:cyclodeaminase/cyclohydrolase family protein [Omnitrophica bacterium]|nr:cyclodeaminase/cyclohydrolase family protein [Candidatus Omnitrophota bacterium]
MYIDGSIGKYLDDLAARKPAPGGGSAAALEAALGCALMSMVMNFTISNKKYEASKEKAAADLKKSEDLRRRVTDLIDADVAAYGKLSEAFKKLGKDSPELQILYKEACNVPFEICKISDEALAICKRLVEYGNKNLVTDTAIAALMLESAFFSGKFNVYINLKYIKDEKYLEEVHKLLSGLEETVPKRKEEVLHSSEEVILK